MISAMPFHLLREIIVPRDVVQHGECDGEWGVFLVGTEGDDLGDDGGGPSEVGGDGG